MVNSDILTGLKNAIEHGESLDSAINVMISSGYNPREINEAAQFLGQGTTSYLQSKPEENLVMPSKKGFFSNFMKKPEQPKIPLKNKPLPQTQYQQLQQPQQVSQMQQQYSSPQISQSQQPAQYKQQIPQMQQQQYKQPQQIPQMQQQPQSQQPQQPAQFQRIQTQQTSIQQNPNAIKQNISSGAVIPSKYQASIPEIIQEEIVPLTSFEPLEKRPPKQNYIREIILLIILLLLLGVLISTIVFKEAILKIIQGL